MLKVGSSDINYVEWTSMGEHGLIRRMAGRQAASLVAAYQCKCGREGEGSMVGQARQVECQHVNQFESTNVKIRLPRRMHTRQSRMARDGHGRSHYRSRSGRGWGANSRLHSKLNKTHKLNELLYK